MKPEILRFPHPAVEGATWWQIWECRARMLLGLIVNRLGLGGLVQPITMDDPVTGQHVEIRVNSLFTEISVDGRDYYFRRFTGKYDGAGMGCSNPSCCGKYRESVAMLELPGKTDGR